MFKFVLRSSFTEGVLARVPDNLSANSLNRSGNGASIRNVQETILILVFFVNAAHQGGSRRQDLINEDEDGFLGAELDTLSNDIDELADGEICGD
jgi:hypothetical protein